MSGRNRRSFLKKSAAASAAYSLFTIGGTKSSGNVIGSNETIRIGVCGLKGRGGGHVGAYAGMKNVEITHLIDVDTHQFEGRAKQVESKSGRRPTTSQDIRTALDDKSLDAISIATCNHTHALYTIWACQAGKDVYVEKPLSHNIYEGRKCVEAARRYDRVVQHGTQQRSMQHRENEIAALQSGDYGKLTVSKGYCCKSRRSIGTKPNEDPPSHLDFNLWLGPAPQQSYHANLVHYNWHWFWDFGNGDTGNQGVHEMDVARWAIPDATLPTKVWSLGGRFGYEDQGQTPNTQLSCYEFGDVLLLFETRGLVGDVSGTPPNVGNEYYTTEGMIKGGKFYPKGGGDAQAIEGGTPRQVTEGGEFGSFIAAVRSRNPEDFNADVEVGHYSAALCHLGNISYRLGEQVPFSSSRMTLGDNKQVVEALEKDQIKDCIALVKLKDEKLKHQGVQFKDQEGTMSEIVQSMANLRLETFELRKSVTNQAPDEDKAKVLLTVEVVLFTTRDDKDNQDVVAIEFWKRSELVASRRVFADVKLDNDSTQRFTLSLPAKTELGSDSELRVRKSGTDGWIFHVETFRRFGDGRVVQILPRSGENHFEDQQDSEKSFSLRR